MNCYKVIFRTVLVLCGVYTEVLVQGHTRSSEIKCVHGHIKAHPHHHCVCDEGYNGTLCDNKICGNGMLNTTSHSCICDNGYEGTDCGQMQIDLCLNGGHFIPQRQICSCVNGHVGPHCEIELKCKNGGTLDKARNVCDCPMGWNGWSCEKIICFNGHANPLHNRCSCYKGFDGLHCAGILRVNCLNGGHFSATEKVCICTHGFTGTNCEQVHDYCESNPCLHGGHCFHDNSTFFCNCPPNYTGRTCETPYSAPTQEPNGCLSNPCHHGGHCFHDGLAFYCVCKHGFTGYRCLTRITTPQVQTEKPTTPKTTSGTTGMPLVGLTFAPWK